MCAVLVLLVPFFLGLFAGRTTATIAYVAAFGPVFTFQTLSLVTDWTEGSTAAFGEAFPASDFTEVLGYGGVNLILYVVGFGLLALGARVAAGRRARRASQPAVELDTVR